ncbi:tyrosine-type recombinase/integrase [Glaesserella parasuis]|uniref:tyrosine-type recombinase/integrase n=1 Tax=Glaesserella parasuis TaxID=738 RepID=UPI0003ABD0C4|nr:site-specific integrase [Glaesserella parasuis]EQA02091.1 phage integrase family protein [Glaesserella parasuis SW114]MDD2172478.1 site-specific integrase [Glaesserella parasuis]MDG6447643.1 site-specific integrase [Glaesserella parasuis]MDG6475787.1 site-specific integrase [Glaesserella parasuis]MDP0272346.1 site-specific integrase [Glaesserella parasuis]
MSFEQLLYLFFLERNHRPATRRSYQNVIAQIVKFYPDKGAEQLSKFDLLEWRGHCLNKMSPITWNSYVRHLKAIFNYAIDNELFEYPKNLFKGLMVRPDKPKKKLLTERQIHFLESSLENEEQLPHYLQPAYFTKALIYTLRYTAIRQSQLLQLKISDIDMTSKIINIRAETNKNHEHHEIPISDKLYPYLKRLILELKARSATSSEQLFNINRFSLVTTSRNQKMTEGQLAHFFRHLSQCIGFKVTSHRFRHTTATEVLKQSGDIYAVKQLLGHKDLTVTLTYIHNDPEMLRKHVNSL